MSQLRVVELESGEKDPQIETLVKIATKSGLEFVIDIAPIGQEPSLWVRRSRTLRRTFTRVRLCSSPPADRERVGSMWIVLQ